MKTPHSVGAHIQNILVVYVLPALFFAFVVLARDVAGRLRGLSALGNALSNTGSDCMVIVSLSDIRE